MTYVLAGKLLLLFVLSFSFVILSVKNTWAAGIVPPVNSDMGCTLSGQFVGFNGSSLSCFQVPYASVTGSPAIPAPQVNADWNATSGVAQILNQPTIPTIAPRSFNNAPARSIVTTAAAANGFQISSTRDAEVSYSVLITVTASITSGQSGYAVLEISPTNSTNAASWLEVSRMSSSQVYSLAVALQGVQGAGVILQGIVPAGYYARIRSINVTGSPTFGFVSGQEVLL